MKRRNFLASLFAVPLIPATIKTASVPLPVKEPNSRWSPEMLRQINITVQNLSMGYK